MRKGIHTTTEPRRTSLYIVIRHLFVAGLLLVWIAGTAAGQESAVEAVEPEEAAETPSTEVAEVDEQAPWEQEWGRQVEELTRHREELQEAARNLERELELFEREQDERRQQLHEQLGEIQMQIRDTDAHLLDLQRERLKQDYMRELEALEQAHEPREWREQERRHPRDEAERMERWGRELGEHIERIRLELREMQEQRERDGNQWREVHGNLETLAQRVRAVERHMQEVNEELDKSRAERREIAEWNEVSTRRQQEELRAHVGEMTEQRRVLAERMEARLEESDRNMDRVRVDLQRMGQTVGRIEDERIEAERSLRMEVGELGNQVQGIREDQLRMQGALNMLLSQCDRSTVGSAGYNWGW